jgi:hypothetical protein
MDKCPFKTKCYRINKSTADCLNFLKSTVNARSPIKLKHVLSNATDKELLAIVDCAFNLVKYRIIPSTRQRRRISHYRDYLYMLSRLRTPKGARKLVQKGNGFAFAAILTPIIAEIIRQYT